MPLNFTYGINEFVPLRAKGIKIGQTASNLPDIFLAHNSAEPNRPVCSEEALQTSQEATRTGGSLGLITVAQLPYNHHKSKPLSVLIRLQRKAWRTPINPTSFR